MITSIILLIGFIIQLVFAKYFSFGGVGINILLLLTIEISLVKGPHDGQLFGFFSGLIEDIFTMGIFGSRALIRTVAGFSIGRLKGKFSDQNIVFQFILTFIIFVIHGIAIYYIRIMFSYPPPVFRSIFIYAALNGFLAPFMYHLVKKTIAG